MVNSLLYKDEVYAVIGSAMFVYNELKRGYLEAVYQEALEIIMRQRGIPFESRKRIEIYFQGEPLTKTYIADIVVDNKIVVELKVKKEIDKEDEAQLMNYLRGTKKNVGLLINFGNKKRLEWRKYFLTDSYDLVEEESSTV